MGDFFVIGGLEMPAMRPQPLRKIEAGFEPVKLPTPPEGLTSDAIEEWSRVGEILLNRGLLGADCLGVLECYCRSYADMRHFAELIRQEGVIQQGKTRAFIHPAHRAYVTAANQVVKFAGELGLTPSRRALGNKLKKEYKYDGGWGDDADLLS
jgi:P27 family predicted phage terminase small subunit